MKQIENTTKKPQAPRIKVDGKKVIVGHDDPVNGCQYMMASLGTTSPEFLEMVLSQIAETLFQGGKPEQNQVNAALAIIAGIEPRDELETMLATQMVAIHNATMTLARRLVHVETLDQQNSAERALNKLSRTFAMQLEALKRYRTGGEQKVVVQHVNVNEGGQAIVGTVDRGRG